MERGEVGVLAVQFGALIIIVLLLSLFTHGNNPQSEPEVNTVWWGGPPPASGSSLSGSNTESVNATNMTAFYSLAYSTHVLAVSASRVCELANGTGIGTTYTNFPISFDSAKNLYYFSFGPTEQRAGWTCDYTITVTDSLQQTTTWVGAVVVKGEATTNTTTTASSTDK